MARVEQNNFESYLLCGFNMIENPQGDTSHVKRIPILDEAKLKSVDENWMSSDEGNNLFEHKVYVSESEYDLYEQIGADAGISGKYNDFGLDFSAKMSKTKNYNQATQFGAIISTCKIEKYQNRLTSEKICGCVSDEFLNNIKTKSAKEIFETYGTHLIVRFSVGGKLDIKFMTNSDTTKTTLEMQEEAKASYLDFSANESTNYSEQAKQFNKDCEYSIKGIGGSLGSLPEVIDGNNNCVAWEKSVRDYPTIYEIDEVVPIWEIISDTTLKKSLEKNYYQLFNEYLKKMMKTIPFVSKLRVECRSDSNIDSHKLDDEIVVRFDREYGGCYADCNKNSDGDYIYVLYTLGVQDESKITDIKINCTDNSTNLPCKTGYEHLPEDLNRNAGGKYIYIDYKAENNNDAATGYQALGIRTTTMPENSCWKIITDTNENPVDLNKGAGGDYLYLFGYVDPIWKAIKDQIEENNQNISNM